MEETGRVLRFPKLQAQGAFVNIETHARAVHSSTHFPVREALWVAAPFFNGTHHCFIHSMITVNRVVHVNDDRVIGYYLYAEELE